MRTLRWKLVIYAYALAILVGRGAVESFAVPMLIGIVVAASSSVFIAAPILLFLGDWRARRRAATAALAAEAPARSPGDAGAAHG